MTRSLQGGRPARVEPNSFDAVVVGNGLFGSAAGRHLAQHGLRVAVIGAPEPADTTDHDGVYASHYDEGRLARRFDKRISWAPLTARAISRYRDLETASGIDFYHPVGALVVGPGAALDAEGFDNPRVSLTEREIAHRLFEPGDKSWRDEFPHLDFPDEFYVVHEPAPAGHINPRRLIKAQNAVAEQHGATIVRQLVTGIEREPARFSCRLATSDPITADNVIVAAGSFTNFNGLFQEPLPLTLETEIIAFGEVSAADAGDLTSTPTVVYTIDDTELSDIYMVPPILYPDGRYYIKLGANTTRDTCPETIDEIHEWFRNGDSDFALPAFRAALRAIWPTTNFLSFHTGRCILTRTPDGDPIIREVEPGLYVATGGNGGGAKGSDAWGEIAADLILG